METAHGVHTLLQLHNCYFRTLLHLLTLRGSIATYEESRGYGRQRLWLVVEGPQEMSARIYGQIYHL
jgi:hypothetical protein